MEKNSSYPVAPPEDMDDDSDDYEKHLEVNWNHVWRDQYEKDLEQYSEIIDASGMDDFLAKTDASGKPVDMHPEKRIYKVQGMPMTEATDQPKNTKVMARPRCKGGTSRPMHEAACGVKMAAATMAMARKPNRL